MFALISTLILIRQQQPKLLYVQSPPQQPPTIRSHTAVARAVYIHNITLHHNLPHLQHISSHRRPTHRKLITTRWLRSPPSCPRWIVQHCNNSWRLYKARHKPLLHQWHTTAYPPHLCLQATNRSTCKPSWELLVETPRKRHSLHMVLRMEVSPEQMVLLRLETRHQQRKCRASWHSWLDSDNDCLELASHGGFKRVATSVR